MGFPCIIRAISRDIGDSLLIEGGWPRSIKKARSLLQNRTFSFRQVWIAASLQLDLGHDVPPEGHPNSWMGETIPSEIYASSVFRSAWFAGRSRKPANTESKQGIPPAY